MLAPLLNPSYLIEYIYIYIYIYILFFSLSPPSDNSITAIVLVPIVSKAEGKKVGIFLSSRF